nr:hypothetical protein [Tanacetum cinerariifolium]
MRRVGKGFSGVETPLFESMLVVRDVAKEAEAQVSAQGDAVQEPAVEEVVPPTPTPSSPPSPVIPSSPPHQPPCPPQPQDAEVPSLLFQQVLDTCSALAHRVEGLENDKAAQQLEIVKLKAKMKKLEKNNMVKSSKLRRLKKVGTSQRVESLDDMENVFNQGRIIADMNQDERIELVADQEKDAEVKVRHADKQAELYKLDLDHSSKVLSMQEDDTEVQEAVEIVTTAKLMTESQQRRPMTKMQKREYYMVVIKSNLEWRCKDFKGMTFEEIEAKFAEVWKQVEDFIPMGSKEEPERLKRKGLNLEKEQVKKQKSSEEAPKIETSTEEITEEKMKEMMQLFPNFMHAPVEWKLYDLSGVHHLTANDREIFMLVEKDYPLRKGLALVMISYKLQVENYSQMAEDLIRKIYKIANTQRSIKFRRGLLGIKCTRHSHCQVKSSHWQYKFPLPVKVVATARRLEMPLPEVCTAIEEKKKKLPYIKRYHGMKKKPQTKFETCKNMIFYLKNTEGYKMDFFKGMKYDEILPIFQAKFDANMRFLFKSREEMEEEDEEIIKSINETPAQKAAKRRKLHEKAKEDEDLKKQLEVVDDEDDDVFIEATPIGRKVPVVDYEIVMINNKPRYKIIKADGTHQLYTRFITLLKNFNREDLEDL